ncbi:Dynamitin-domain-containing protein [Pilobolus umbonatus]|nr:Dynamitin-domain-containing protein [Pilobolus umbonatus]
MYRTYVKRPPAFETNEYEILPKGIALNETALQKLRRLMFEVQELNEEVEKNKESIQEDVSQADILSQISYLQNDLVRMNKQLGDSEEIAASGYGQSIEATKSLIKQLEAFKSAPADSPPTTEEVSEELAMKEKNDMVTYELYYTPEAAKMQKETKLSDIDERIAKLEKLIGSSAGQALEDLPAHLASSSLINSLSKLEQQISVLAQPRQLEMVVRRVKLLNSDLDRLNELKSGRKENISAFGFGSTQNAAINESANKEVNVNDSETKINQLFDTLEKVDPLLNLTPVLLTRLKALQGLHSEAASFAQSVKVISEEQTRISDELKSLKATCDLLNTSLKDNDESVTSNISIIDTRITDLVQRISDLTSA